ncbi:hypothetical protein LCGC14_1371620 [marine sediment metagenome]|uniref:Uncharacterized protein n=1 Tax=marine sediment metagenome TaxID=412755 RepID=A0A0F9MKI6_9ZZZZ
MSKKILLGLDIIFAGYGAFWAGLLFITALSDNLTFWFWIGIFSIMALFLYPLIRKLVEVFFERFGIEWKGFESDWKTERVKKRWEY